MRRQANCPILKGGEKPYIKVKHSQKRVGNRLEHENGQGSGLRRLQLHGCARLGMLPMDMLDFKRVWKLMDDNVQ